MAKIIILVRISTTRQEILTQKKELEELAIADGWTNESDRIVIEGVGASAIKLNDIYLQEMEELYQTIEDSEIAAVYAWEISRIGRNEEILMRFKNFLIERKIQLVIKNPSLRLLNNDGSVNNGIELAFSLFATMAAQEMKIKKERFKRARERNKAEGKYNGGPIKFGYYLDETKHFQVKEEQAKVVRDMYDWYINGLTLHKIHNKLVDIGVLRQDIISKRGKRVGEMLRDISYKGGNGYPQIVNAEIWDKVSEMLSHNHFYQSKNVYYCKGLLVDKKTGLKLTARVGTASYYIQHPNINYSINMNVLDYIVKSEANILLARALSVEAQTNLNEYKLKIKENKTTIKSKETQIAEYEKAIGRSIEMNIAQPKYYPKEKMEATIRRNEKMIEELRKDIVNIQTDNTRMENYLNGNMTFINQIKDDYSDDKKKEIIDSVIHRIQITKNGNRYMIEIVDKFGITDQRWFEYVISGHNFKVIRHWNDQEEDITDIVRKHKRFTRKRYDI